MSAPGAYQGTQVSRAEVFYPSDITIRIEIQHDPASSLQQIRTESGALCEFKPKSVPKLHKSPGMKLMKSQDGDAVVA